MRTAKRGKKLSEEHKRHIGDGNRGKIRSDETLERMRMAHKNQKHKIGEHPWHSVAINGGYTKTGQLNEREDHYIRYYYQHDFLSNNDFLDNSVHKLVLHTVRRDNKRNILYATFRPNGIHPYAADHYLNNKKDFVFVMSSGIDKTKVS
jgi:hypothetical protein